MYFRKAIEFHLPIIIIVYGGVLGSMRYIIMAPPARLEWVPTSELVKPRISKPIASTAALMSIKYSVEERCENLVPS